MDDLGRPANCQNLVAVECASLVGNIETCQETIKNLMSSTYRVSPPRVAHAGKPLGRTAGPPAAATLGGVAQLRGTPAAAAAAAAAATDRGEWHTKEPTPG